VNTDITPILDEEGKSPEELLERFAIERSLVLVGELSRWREESPGEKFTALMIPRHRAISENLWADEISSLKGAPFYLPCSDSSLPAKVEPEIRNAFATQAHTVILQVSPVVVAAMLNPFEETVVRNMLSVKFPGVPSQLVTVSPHAWVRLEALASADRTWDGNWDEEMEKWCPLLGMDPRFFLDVGSVVEELWIKYQTPVVPSGFFTDADEIPAIEDGLVVWRTPLSVWAVSHRPLSNELKEMMAQMTGRSVKLVAVGPTEYARLKELASKKSGEAKARTTVDSLHIQSWGTSSDSSELLQRLLASAISMGASDIHIEPKTDRARVRFRIDNEMHEQAPLNKATYFDVLRRMKIQGKMMQEKSGLIQDGAGWVMHSGTRYDLRYGVTVVDGGEDAVVVRIFSSSIPDIRRIGLDGTQMKTLDWFMGQDSGMAIFSGPTGSGKTTTLYAMLKALDRPELDIVTIEQPVEKHFEPAKQITVFEEGVLTFATALRSILRQDPDVIMVGEMRDVPSATKAVEAAMTGHLVLSTTHANSAVGVIDRLVGSFAIDRVSLSCALRLSVAQRLVSRLCPFCKTSRPPKASDLEHFPPVSVARPVICERSGCAMCRGTGLMGRHLIMEIMVCDQAVREMIALNRNPQEIERYCRSRGFPSLVEQATWLLQNGEISLDAASQFVERPLV
jgi:type II secretory ATPase GspE/PulE/Tfp pilus assembly ATPase PilB-like protein